MTPVVEVHDLGKRYRISTRQKVPETMREAATALLRAPFSYWSEVSRPATEAETLWALRHTSFRIEPGEVLGIVGRNGSGKSTLLKILSRITEPTEGWAVLHGRVGSLLEVGTGFHPELTGRENIYLSGTILGMRRDEIDRKLDEIVAFSEIERFLDTPAKRYSSGMYVRLGFSVAAHLEPEILIVDEVLAVGDAAFQRKCLGRMQEIGKTGRTIIFVSHSMSAVQNLCSRLLWLDAGEVVAEGEAGDIASAYLKATMPPETNRLWSNSEPAQEDERVRLHQILVAPATPSPDDTITIETPVAIEIQFWNHIPRADLDIKLYVMTEIGQLVFVSVAGRWLGWDHGLLQPGLYRSTCHIPGNLLNAGQYRLTIRIMRNANEEVARKDDVLSFDVSDEPARAGYSYGEHAGVIRPLLKWTFDQLSPEQADISVSTTQS